MNSAPAHCWDCVHHRRELFETEFRRPLFFYSVCRVGETISDVVCDSFLRAVINDDWGLAVSDPSTVLSFSRE